eukprot:Seg249.7 transcript_id=Seg249.7/GoldUCD/mRNA.D3Y31 product="hypothetical protein" pseudo=true protein_id=Seg249.7/GoldUCD/D3Y31
MVPKYDVVVSGCRSGVLKTWHADSCTQIGEINAHSKAINAITANSSLVFTASSDRLVRIWKPTPTMDEQEKNTQTTTVPIMARIDTRSSEFPS